MSFTFIQGRLLSAFTDTVKERDGVGGCRMNQALAVQCSHTALGRNHNNPESTEQRGTCLPSSLRRHCSCWPGTGAPEVSSPLPARAYTWSAGSDCTVWV